METEAQGSALKCKTECLPECSRQTNECHVSNELFFAISAEVNKDNQDGLVMGPGLFEVKVTRLTLCLGRHLILAMVCKLLITIFNRTLRTLVEKLAKAQATMMTIHAVVEKW